MLSFVPSAEAVAKLPKWARDYITQLEVRRETAERALSVYTNEQAPSPYFVTDFLCTRLDENGTFYKRYIHAPMGIHIKSNGVKLEVKADYQGGIRMQWDGASNRCQHVAFVPESFQHARLISKDNMR